MLPRVFKPGQYLGNEWGARRKPFAQSSVRMALAFPDMYELGMSNFGLKILYQLLNDMEGFMVDRTYAPGGDLEKLMREKAIPLFAFESREPLYNFDLIGFSLQYELTYTNVVNMLDLAQLPVKAADRKTLFPLTFGGGPSAVNPEPMALFLDFFMIGDGEQALPHTMHVVEDFKASYGELALAHPEKAAHYRLWLLAKLASEVPGVYAPILYRDAAPVAVAREIDEVVAELLAALPEHADEIKKLSADGRGIPKRVLRQVAPLNDQNQPTHNLVSYLALVHDRETLEVRRGCDRGCRFCQPGYTFLPVRERSVGELVELSKKALANSGHEEYSMLSLCVSDYTSLHESVRALNREHSAARTSLSFPSQRADRMSLELADELKAVRKSGITLAPEAGSEKLRAVINKGLSHQQIISAIESAYQSGWSSVKLYFMCGLPFEDDSDLAGIVDILKEATHHCRVIRNTDRAKYKRDIDFTCTISNFVPKPFTPFQWFGQVKPRAMAIKHQVLRAKLKEAGLRNVQLNVTDTQISLLEAVISRGDRRISELIYRAWKDGAVFDAWDEHFKPERWHRVAESMGLNLEELACTDQEVGSRQPYDVVHIGLADFWLVREWEKAVKAVETAPCTENVCHACGICTILDTNHELAQPIPAVMKKNPFVKELSANTSDEDSHPSLFFTAPPPEPIEFGAVKLRFAFTKLGDLRFIGHLDLLNLLIRASRRAGLELSYSQGFNPAPKLSLAQALPIFQESLYELADIELAQIITPDQFMERLNRQLPPEVQIVAAMIAPGKDQALNQIVAAASYEARLLPSNTAVFGDVSRALLDKSSIKDTLTREVERILNSESLLVYGKEKEARAESPVLDKKLSNEGELPKQKGKEIRPLIHRIELLTKEDGLALLLELATGSKGHLKPLDVLDLICPEAQLNWRITRLSFMTQALEPIQITARKENTKLTQSRG
ncbi:MAG: TIGR03960 family B12-binding radical SAM protein [Cyanobacteria bacterium SZAS TMP-1]|nr:TIGR03960 family B12-binding radical SAM protein [Cyanobacteria bacterium SZAS TMP-1]